jgi:hypothetical protein
MGKLLIAKSGKQENPVTDTKELSISQLNSVIGNRKLIFLSPQSEELPPLGLPSKVDGVKGPDCVVILVSEVEASSLKCKGQGFYLVDDLHPSDLTI